MGAMRSKGKHGEMARDATLEINGHGKTMK